ncbi:acyl-CoA dehydrogenase family protein [Marinomonas mediterranea]|jgi:Acyl-CoA dehydrogenases|uniref:Butyryl-CoA dehydrogenase n=1 Tax=Marinomonas mediterranea (strain ATCC 700492 / JCM 21426 / NBRC 103028 / MMB-1) TaxID=717774 RepID=F2K077_MARM1|nr:acyl-CoA dehydrogenase family protein [Marinomonas mediterranea]ADZ93291.1 Butyryl-CoA dehydrogenase [Marinomonas mediterranea MMB-1]WCN19289.1 acyl-CoA dehydrogenase [Marinomonas mediterranea MMB-1]6CXT_B Chain B, Butyryl-CoA dehydrogenase [Marinomonas mediterranea MMB-1]6CY8_B Chain B, Butyryl-CoA dehydrogenase [Marinomonas mediterranea MMB-1]
MNFEWTHEQAELFEHALRFGKELSAPLQEDNGFPRDNWNALGDFGYFGLPIPEKYAKDGSGFDILTTIKIIEGLGQSCTDTGLLFAGAAHTFACSMPILEHGSETLKHQLLPDLATGRKIAANAISEASAGSDISNLATTAQKEGDYYVLNGGKSYVTNGSIADYYVVYATTNKKHGYLGQTAFVVPRNTPGISVGNDYHKLGLRSAPLNQVFFDNCTIHKDYALGREGQGARIFAASMDWERCCLFAIFVGAMQRDLNQCIEYANTRMQGDKTISRFQAVSHRIADMGVRLESARLMLYYAAWQKSQDVDNTKAVAMSKLAISEAFVQSGIDSIRVHGALGYLDEGRVNNSIKDALGSVLFSGTSDIQRELICNRLGLL